MTYLLDTNVVVALLRDQPHGVRTRLRGASISGALLAVSSVVLFELSYGVAQSSRPRENAERLRIFVSGGINVWAFEEEDAAAAGELRAQLEAAGTSIGPYDLLIAGQALRHDATLVTANVAEFARVPALRWEDWTSTSRPDN